MAMGAGCGRTRLRCLYRGSSVRALYVMGKSHNGSSCMGVICTVLPRLGADRHKCLGDGHFPYVGGIVCVNPRGCQNVCGATRVLLLKYGVSSSRLLRTGTGIGYRSAIGVRCASNAANFPGKIVLARCGVDGGNFLANRRVGFASSSGLYIYMPLFRYFKIMLTAVGYLARKYARIVIRHFSPLLMLTSIRGRHYATLCKIPAVFVTRLGRPVFSVFSVSDLHANVVTNSLYPIRLVGHIRRGVFVGIADMCKLARTSPNVATSHVSSSFSMHYGAINHSFRFARMGIVSPRANRRYPVNMRNRVYGGKCGAVGKCCGGPRTATRIVSQGNFLRSKSLKIGSRRNGCHVAKQVGSVVVHNKRGVCPQRVRRFLCRVRKVGSMRMTNVPSGGCKRTMNTFVVLRRKIRVGRFSVHSFYSNGVTHCGVPGCVFFISRFPVANDKGVRGFGLGSIKLRLYQGRNVRVVWFDLPLTLGVRGWIARSQEKVRYASSSL